MQNLLRAHFLQFRSHADSLLRLFSVDALFVIGVILPDVLSISTSGSLSFDSLSLSRSDIFWAENTTGGNDNGLIGLVVGCRQVFNESHEAFVRLQCTEDDVLAVEVGSGNAGDKLLT